MQRGSVLPIVLILIVLVGLGVGVYFLQNSRTSTTSEAAAPIQKKVIPSPDSENQKTNIESVGLSFGLPNGFQIVKETEEEYFKRANGEIRKNFKYYVQYDPAEFAESFYVVPEGGTNLDKAILSAWIFKNPDNLDPEKFYGKYWYYPFVWGDYTARRNEIDPENAETIGGKTGGSGIVEYREGKPKFIYLSISEKNLMMQIQLPTENNQVGQQVLSSLKFE